MARWKTIAPLLIACAVAGACAEEKPDYAAMRAHRLKTLSDAQLRKFDEEAKVEFEKAKQYAKTQEDESWKKKSEQLAKCNADAAYRARNPDDCRIGLMAGQLIPESAERRFERKLMGICDRVQTVRDARKAGCLP